MPRVLLAFLALTITTSIAAAAPLAQKWRSAGCPDFGLVRTDKEISFVDRKTKTIVRRDIATGKVLAPIKIAQKKGNLEMSLGDLYIVSEYANDVGTFTGVDAAGKAKWPGVKAEKAFAVDGVDFATVVRAKDKVTIQRIAGATGKAAWTAAIPGTGTLNTFVGDSASVLLGISDDKAKTFTATLVDAKTGAVTWTQKLAFKTYRGGLLDAAGIVVDEEKMGTNMTVFHVYDRATGKETGNVSYKHAFPAIVGGGKLFVGSNDLDKSVGALTAVDIKGAKQLWTVQTPAMFESFYGFGGGGLAANLGNDMLRIVDVTNGKILATYAVSSAGEFKGTGAGAAITFCDERDIVALDLGGTDETAKISGTITCKNCDGKSYPVRMGDVTGKTDDKGKFTLTVVGAGRYRLQVPYEENGDSIGDAGKYVLLTGKGTYDLGTIKLEIEPNGD